MITIQCSSYRRLTINWRGKPLIGLWVIGLWIRGFWIGSLFGHLHIGYKSGTGISARGCSNARPYNKGSRYMSGGSFNNLFIKDGADLLDATDDLQAMVEQLEGWAPGTRALHNAQRLLIDINEMKRRLAQLSNSSLAKVFHDVEWAVSHDYSKERALETIQQYEEKP
jgi:hypothetical protein